MLLRSFLQVAALFLFAFVFLLIVAVAAAYAGYLGPEVHAWAEWGWMEAIARRDLIQKAFALIGAVSTLIISALGVYKTWHFADLNLPARLDALCERWRQSVIRRRIDVIPELSLVHSFAAIPDNRQGFLGWLLSLFYDGEQAALLRCSRKLDKLEAELKTLSKSHERCRAEVLTSYLELGSRMRRCDPKNGQGALNLFKKPLETESGDWDALELAGRQALVIGMRQQACTYLLQLIETTQTRQTLRHARALRFYAEVLHGGTPNDRDLARSRLESAITVLEESDTADPTSIKDELGLAQELLAKVQIARGRFRSARIAVREAKRHLGDIDRLKDLDGRAAPQR